MFIPSAAQGLLLPFAATVAHRRCLTLTNSLSSNRGLRPDNSLPLQRVTAPRLRRHTPPLQSVVRSQGFTTAWQPVVVKSHTRRSRSPVTHPKTPVGSSPRPMPAAPLPYKSSYPLLLASSFLQHLFSLYRPSRRCHGFCNAWASTLPPQSWSVMPPFRVLVLVPAGEHSARRQHRPAPRDGLPLLLHRPGQESQRSLASSIFLLAIAPLRHMPSAATCLFESLFF